jgi:hypothetical protein
LLFIDLKGAEDMNKHGLTSFCRKKQEMGGFSANIEKKLYYVSGGAKCDRC